EASAVYVASKHRASEQVGMRAIEHSLPADASIEETLGLIVRLNEDPEVIGILWQLPLPGHLDEAEVTNRIIPEKDVAGLTEESGILCQLPLRGRLDGVGVAHGILAEKDDDGLTVESGGRLAVGLEGLSSCTAVGVMRRLRAAAAESAGPEAVILGR